MHRGFFVLCLVAGLAICLSGQPASAGSWFATSSASDCCTCDCGPCEVHTEACDPCAQERNWCERLHDNCKDLLTSICPRWGKRDRDCGCGAEFGPAIVPDDCCEVGELRPSLWDRFCNCLGIGRRPTPICYSMPASPDAETIIEGPVLEGPSLIDGQIELGAPYEVFERPTEVMPAPEPLGRREPAFVPLRWL